MSGVPLNEALLPGNACFGCGLANPAGMHLHVRRDDDDASRLLAHFDPPAHARGFPGLTHGGALFTVMDCLATWVVATLREGERSFWLLGGARVEYRKAAPIGRPLELAGWLGAAREGSRTALVHVEARDAAGDVVAVAEFTEVPVAPDRFRQLAGVDEIPAAWRELFA